MMKLEELAPAKINLALAVSDLRADGYHEVDTVLHSVDLADSIYIEAAKEDNFTCTDETLPCGPGNLAYDALALLREYTGITEGIRMHLLKRIPMGAGLGGGSANAAAVLRGLNRFWNLNLTAAEMLSLAMKLGSDVPFCLHGGAARGTGRGEVLQPLPILPETNLVIVKPTISVSTAAAYRAFDETEERSEIYVDEVVKALYEGETPKVWNNLGNAFESVLFPLHPELRRISEIFRKMNYPVLMSGAGSAFFVVVPHARDCDTIVEQMRESEPAWQVLITKTRGGY